MLVLVKFAGEMARVNPDFARSLGDALSGVKARLQ
jgi:hypothetical protein